MKPTLRAAAFGRPLPASTLALTQMPGRHPHRIHALSDLRAAQWQSEHRRPEDGEMREDELVASDEVAAAIHSTTSAAAADAKDLGWNTPPDAPSAYDGRPHAAIDLLHAAHNGLALPEDDPAARNQQHLALLRVDDSHE
jgi:hypothetical protein